MQPHSINFDAAQQQEKETWTHSFVTNTSKTIFMLPPIPASDWYYIAGIKFITEKLGIPSIWLGRALSVLVLSTIAKRDAIPVVRQAVTNKFSSVFFRSKPKTTITLEVVDGDEQDQTNLLQSDSPRSSS